MSAARRTVIALTLVTAGVGAARLAAADAVDWRAELIARTDDIAREVSSLRGLSIKRTLERGAVDRAGVRDRLAAQVAEELTPAQVAARQLALERWGLIAPGTDAIALLLDVSVDQVAGYYDHADHTLYIAERAEVSGEPDDEARTRADLLMAHEIVHALQDQHFDLDKLTDLPLAEADARLARQALIEGDGVVASYEVMLARKGVAPPWGMDDAVTMLAKSMEATGRGDRLADAPLVVRDLLMFPYTGGMRFVAALRARRAWKRVDDAFKQPPASTEQILHPELYLAGEQPHRVAAATPAALAGWTASHETVWGEAGWSVILRQQGVDADRAATAAAGWGGDRAVVYTRAGGTTSADAVGVSLTSWDTPLDAMEFEEAAVLAIDAIAPGTEVEATRSRSVWLGVDARVSVVERRGDQVVVIVGAPLAAQGVIADDVWNAWSVKK